MRHASLFSSEQSSFSSSSLRNRCLSNAAANSGSFTAGVPVADFVVEVLAEAGASVVSGNVEDAVIVGVNTGVGSEAGGKAASKLFKDMDSTTRSTRGVGCGRASTRGVTA